MHQDLFTTWGCEFDVTLSADRARLVFTPRRTPEGLPIPRNLFHKPGGHERPYETLLTAFLSLNADSPPETWQAVAAQLGPLFAPHPFQRAMEHEVVNEPRSLWLEARDDLSKFWERFQALPKLSTTPLSLEERRAAALTAIAVQGADVDAVSPEELEPLIEAHMPHEWQTERREMMQSLGTQLNGRFMPPAPPIAPLINEETARLELVFPLGIQALFFMSVALAREDRTSFPTRCGRHGCTRVSFMRGMKRYCSKACQEAEKSARHRRKKTSGQRPGS